MQPPPNGILGLIWGWINAVICAASISNLLSMAKSKIFLTSLTRILKSFREDDRGPGGLSIPGTE